MSIVILRANKRHLKDINRLIVETRIGSPMREVEGIFWFIRKNGQIVGCMGAELLGNDTAILTHLAVREIHRRQGIGMVLFNHAIQFCRSKGITTIAFITMYYHFRRFKKRGFRTSPRRFLPDDVRNHWMFTAKRYMKCAPMIQEFNQ